MKLFLIAATSAIVARILSASEPAAVSVAGEAPLSASGHSYAPTLSADGRYVVFISDAKNLVANDNLAPYLDVFRHDLQTGETILISRSADRNGGANADSQSLSISSNGQWIAFASTASDLLPGPDTNSGADIFFVNANSLQCSLISALPDGTFPANPLLPRNLPLSDKPIISADGRWVAFESFATNLTAEADTNDDSDVFLRDTWSNRTALISVGLGGATTANGKSQIVALTPDGKSILFLSTATNLMSNNPTNGLPELYVRQLDSGSTTWVRHTVTRPYACRGGVISPDGRFVLFKVELNQNSGVGPVFLYDRQTNGLFQITFNSWTALSINMTSDARFVAYDEYSTPLYLWSRETGSRTLISSGGTSHSPVFSDDGSIIAFVNSTASASNLAFQMWYQNRLTGQSRRVTDTLSGTASLKDHHSSSIAIDPANQFIVFDSADDNLVAGDRNQARDIFIRYLATGKTRLITRAHESAPPFTALTASSITNFCLSEDGNRLLFFSSDSNFVPNDTNAWQDAFVRDLGRGQTFALSTNTSGMFSPTNWVRHAILTANGRFALLGIVSSSDRNEPAGGAATIVRKDLDSGETRMVLSNGMPPAGAWPPQLPFFAFSISADGSRVAYASNGVIIMADLQMGTQTNLTRSSETTWNAPVVSPDGRYITHVSNRVALTITDLSTGQRITIATNYPLGAAFSQNNQIVVYSAGTGSGSTSAIYLYAIAPQSNTLVCTDCATPSVSADGRFVTYEKSGSGPRQIEVKDVLDDKRTLVTANIRGNGAANRDATWPVISADGRFVAYTSKATNLTTDLPNGWNNLYVYDRLQGSTIRITGARGNRGYGSGSASRPVLGPDGRTLVFQSFASDFVANDFNDTRDIFLLKLGEGDADNDGMSDSWEQTYFSITDRDGTGDFDQDGQSDLAEYLAGTNPTNSQSIFEVLTITSVSTGQRQLIWRAEPGKSYRVEYKPDVQSETWTGLGQIVTASSTTASAIDSSATAEKRFYRVALVQ